MFLASGAPISPNTNGPFDDFWYGPAGTMTASGLRVGPEQARRLAAVSACVKVISESSAMLPAILYQRVDERTKSRATKHPLYKILRCRPNAWQTAMEWRELMQAHVLLRGNAYSEIVTDGRGEITELLPHHPDRVKIDLLGGRRFRYMLTEADGTVRPIVVGEMFHLRGLSSDGIVGLNPIEEHRETIGMGLAAQDYGARFFQNDATPPGWIEHPAHFKTDEDRDKFKASWREAQTGRNRGNTAVLPHGMKYHQIEIKNTDAQFLESRRFSVEEIARIFRVPPHKLQDLSHATFCLPADVQVFTEAGPKSIAEITAGERVWSIGPDRKPVLAPVLRSACTGEDEILEIKTRARTLRCNARHRVLVRRETYELCASGRGNWVKIDGQKYRRSVDVRYIEAGEIREGDCLVAPMSLPNIGGNDALTRKADVPFMESLGMILGDGFFARNSKTGIGSTFGISHSKDAPYLSAYVSAIESSFCACDGPYGMRNGGTAALVAKRRDETTTVFYSTLAYDELMRCGIIGTSKTKRVPAWVFGLSREFKLAFIRGYLDADGTVNKNGCIRFVSVNRTMIDQFRHLCMDCGIRVGNIFSTEIKSNFAGYGDYTHTLYAFICSDTRRNAEIGSHTPMYNERIARKIEDRKARVVQLYRSEERRRFANEDFSYHRVIAITKAPREAVYDLEVEGTHSFIANGVVVHNSNVEHLGLQFVTDTLMPWLIRWEQAIDRDLLPEESEDELFVEFLVDALLRGDTKSRYDAYRSGIQAGWLTRNEARVKENMDPLEGLDEPLEPLNMVRAGDERDDGERRRESDTRETDSQPGTEREERADRLARAAAKRVVNGELAALRKAYERSLATTDQQGLADAVEQFYAKHESYVTEVMLCDPVTARAWCRRQRDAVLQAADQEIERCERCVTVLLDGWADSAPEELAALVEGTRRIATLPALIAAQTADHLGKAGEVVRSALERVSDGIEAITEAHLSTTDGLREQARQTAALSAAIGDSQRTTTESLSRVAAEIAKPSVPVFDGKGNVIGVRKVDRID